MNPFLRFWWRFHRGLVDPELAAILTPPQVRAIFDRVRTARGRKAMTRGGLVFMIFVIIPGIIAFFFALRLLRKLAMIYISRYMEDVVMIVGVSGMFITLMMMWRSAYAPTMYRTIREFGHDVCPKCGYWLRGLGEEIDHCPECGAKREMIHGASAEESRS